MVFFGDVRRFEFNTHNPLPTFTGKTVPKSLVKMWQRVAVVKAGLTTHEKKQDSAVMRNTYTFGYFKNACSAIINEFKNSSIFPRGLTEELLLSDICGSTVWRYFEDTKRYITNQLVPLYYATVKGKKEPSGMENKKLCLDGILLNF